MLFVGFLSGQSSVDAYPGGLLHGKPMIGQQDNRLYNQMTDGDDSTYGLMNIFTGFNQGYSYNFAQPVDIEAYQMKSDLPKGADTELLFTTVDDQGKKWHKYVRGTEQKGNKVTLSAPIKNVTSISISRGYGDIIKLYEFDVFGKINDTTPPAIVKGLNVKTGLTDAVLRWNPNTTDLDIKGYYVYLNGKFVDIVYHPKTEYEFKKLSPNTTYKFEVSAVDLSDNESAKVAVQATTYPPLGKPVLKVGTVSPDSLELFWANTGVTYVLYKDGNHLLDLTGTKHVVKGLQPDTSYTFRLRVTDALNQTALSDVITVKTSKLPPPADLQLSSQSVKHNEARLIWNDIGLSSYTLYRNGSKYQDVKGNFFQEYSLNPDTAYEYQVVTKDALGREIKSNVVKFRTLVAPKPKPPPPPPPPPPKCADSNNADLNSATDYLCQGANDAKDESLLIIAVAVMLLIIVFGTLWLLKVYKKKMTSSVSSSSR